MNNLKRIREECGLSQSKLATAAGVNLQMLKFYEQGVKDINKASAMTLYKLATALQVKIEDLLEIENNTPKRKI